eukprot:4410250-Karenia_brevis.AAC.1
MQAQTTEKFKEVDDKLAAHQKQLSSHDEDIADLRKSFAALSSSVASAQRSRSAPGHSDDGRNSEAFLSGFPNMERDDLLKRAGHVVGQPKGFVKISAPNGISNYVFVRFDSPESAREFIEVRRNKLPEGLFVKPNQSKERRDRNKLSNDKLAQARAEMVAKGCTED